MIAHGFAGSQQLMLPFALTLAQNGYVAITFDLPGHGRNREPLLGGIANDEKRDADLLGAVDQVTAFARTLPQSDGRLALLGHSMASDIVVRDAAAHPDISATVAVSLFSPGANAVAARNLLVIVGALEPPMIRDEGARVAGLPTGAPLQPRMTTGSFADGTARRFSMSGGVEHIAVLYSRQSMEEALDWLNATFGRTGSGWVDTRGPWLGLLFLGIIALSWPLARALPRLSEQPLGAGLGWPRLLAIAVVPAILTPLLLWKLPTDFLPSLLGDYITAHFAIYGLLTGAGLWLSGCRPKLPVDQPFWITAGALAAWFILSLGYAIDRYVTAFRPTPERFLLLLAMLVGTALYFAADEWLIRGVGARRGAAVATKLCLLASLMLAIALNPARLFFLIIIVPVILAFLIIYGLFSAWAYRQTLHPWVGAFANAVAFAWAIAVTFPVVGR